MAEWQIDRIWLYRDKDGTEIRQTTVGLAESKIVCLLGAAGLGKTYEIRKLAAYESSIGRHVKEIALGKEIASGHNLSELLTNAASENSGDTSVFLDGLDEAMMAEPKSAAIIEDWISSDISPNCKIRISCRSAVWPGILTQQFESKNDAYIFELMSLSMRDLEMILEIENLQTSQVLKEISKKNYLGLAFQPLSLKLLLKEFRETNSFVSSRIELFNQCVHRLCGESIDNLERGISTQFSTNELIEAAERLAVFFVTTGNEIVDFEDRAETKSTGLNSFSLSSLPSDSLKPLSVALLRTLAGTGLFVGRENRQFCFLHRQFEEYLAGRRIAGLPFFQSQAILSQNSEISSNKIAGPLRETAAVAASYNPEIADWIVTNDPEIIGLSDIVDDAIRRKGLNGYLKLFRSHKMTISNLTKSETRLDGFKYNGVERCLKKILHERGEGLLDLHACVLTLVEQWEIKSISESVADMVLDTVLPFHTRKEAGYTLYEVGNDKAKEKLKSLISIPKCHEDQELVGLALMCNWPQNINVEELLTVLIPPIKSNYGGAYQGFLHKLEVSGFDAVGDRIAGLKWSLKTLDTDRFCRTRDLGEYIVLRAVKDFNNPEVLSLFVQYILQNTREFNTPFEAIKNHNEGELGSFIECLKVNLLYRRMIIDELIKVEDDWLSVTYSFRSIPGLMQLDDFEWLLSKACDTSITRKKRELYAKVSVQCFPWDKESSLLELWLKYAKTPELENLFGIYKKTVLRSEFAKEQQENYRALQKLEQKSRAKPHSKKVNPPLLERMRILLDRTQKDPRWFGELVRHLELTETSEIYELNRFIVKTKGWPNITSDVQLEITEAAKKYLMNCPEMARKCRSYPLDNILSDGGMAALFHIIEIQPAWIHQLSIEWWDKWSWYILRELHFNLYGEDDEPKRKLFILVSKKVPNKLREFIVKIACSKPGSSTLESLLNKMVDIEDKELDGMLCESVKKKKVKGPNLLNVTSFILKRSPDQSVDICLSRIYARGHNKPESPTVQIALALLNEQPNRSWQELKILFRKRSDLAKHIIGKYAYKGFDEGVLIKAIGFSGLGELCDELLRLFPPESDPEHDGAHFISENDSAVFMRNQLLNCLSRADDNDAIMALRKIVSKYSLKYPWLIRLASSSKYRYELSQWNPIPLQSIAAILDNSEKRLISSGRDVVDAVIQALSRYEKDIKEGFTSKLDELWNDPYQGVKDSREIPSPKSEEHFSDKVCEVIQYMFREYAVIANREVQIQRQKTPKKEGGARGSTADVIVDIPTVSTVGGQKIKVIIEVKRSCNKEASTGMREQLSKRYLVQEGTNCGVFVVVFFDTRGGLRKKHKPIWKTIEEARDELDCQAQAIIDESSNEIYVKPYVLDATRN